MIKNIYSFLLIFILLACSSNSTNKNSDTQLKETNHQSKNEIKDEIESVEISEFDNSDEYIKSTIKYYSGTLGDNPISMVLLESNYGVYIYNHSGKAFKINCRIKNDSLNVKRSKETSDEIFRGIINNETHIYNGIWYKKDNSLPFELKEELKSQDKIQQFVDLSEENFIIDKEGLYKPYDERKIEEFNTFYYKSEKSAAWDTGREWEEIDKHIFFYDSTVVFIECQLSNSEEYLDSEDEPKLSMTGQIKYKVISNNNTVEETIKLKKQPSTYSCYLFKDYIIIMDDKNESYLSYKFERHTQKVIKH